MDSDRGLVPMTPAMSPEQQKEFAKWAVASRKFKHIRSPQQAIILMQYGRELGMGPATALQSVYEVDGVPCLKANTIAARIKTVPWQGTNKPRYDYRIVQLSLTVCEIEFFERGDDGVFAPRGRLTYDLNDAKRAGRADKDQYKKYPRSMLFSRCLTAGARIYCPDCLGGIAPYTPDELSSESDTVLDADFTVSSDEEGSSPWGAGDGEIDSFQEPKEAYVSEDRIAQLEKLARSKNANFADVISGLGIGSASEMTESQLNAATSFVSAL